ncbi:hypothetical protein GYMLUDRAFT_63701 [Collybiopsis luxurians FD-317 M1]|uniref:Unplaced genomic scaffold GYMLUscaffold_81, whole genome shotgun sequence n=1 Tax=Collybiopsis luxurians FD-317 M1 TaxID=944289 RepID=A0A0D0CEN8_9AGAR|nr:hypothetical protein GYMLUDRAFT_63701 [Collybiopsis luxurians FD-317 M1]
MGWCLVLRVLSRILLIFIPASMREAVHPCGRLAVELLLKIASEVPSNSELATLSLLCKYYNVVFNGCPYRSPDASALSTLARHEFDRLPLQTPHPASFVKVFTADENARSETIAAALVNLNAYRVSLKGLVLSTPHIPLAYFIPFPLPHYLQSICELSLQVPYPISSLSLARSLFLPSLTVCKLFFEGTATPVKYSTIASLLRSLVGARLARLTIEFPKSSSATDIADIFTNLFDEPAFRFPLLRALKIVAESLTFSLDIFLMRHPGLEELEYFRETSLSALCTFSSPQTLPNL